MDKQVLDKRVRQSLAVLFIGAIIFLSIKRIFEKREITNNAARTKAVITEYEKGWATQIHVGYKFTVNGDTIEGGTIINDNLPCFDSSKGCEGTEVPIEYSSKDPTKSRIVRE